MTSGDPADLVASESETGDRPSSAGAPDRLARAMTWRLIEADCIEAMQQMEDSSVDAIVTDPPYGLEFMGKEWDHLGKSGVQRQTDVGGGDRRAIVDADEWAGGESSPYSRSRVRWQHGDAGPAAMQEWHHAWATEALRVLKPGGHLLAFGGTRTYHRLACAIEDAGFEIRDCLAWMYGSGFPKSLDVSKAIDKMDAVAERDDRAKRSQAWLREHVTPQQVNDVTGTDMGHHLTTHPTQPFVPTPTMLDQLRPLLPPVPDWLEGLVTDRAVESANFAARQVTGERAGSTMPGFARIADGQPTSWKETTAHTPDAEQWQGWGTALKPAFEPIVLARKPLVGTVAANVLEHGTGALNIDGTRIEGADGDGHWTHKRDIGNGTIYSPGGRTDEDFGNVNPASGRWPANVVLGCCGNEPHDEGCAVALLDEQTGESASSARPRLRREMTSRGIPGGGLGQGGNGPELREPDGFTGGFDDFGGASRFFYVAKSASAERNRGLEHHAKRDDRPAIGQLHEGTSAAGNTQARTTLERTPTPPSSPSS